MKFVPLTSDGTHTIDGVIVRSGRHWVWSLIVDVRSAPRAIPDACGTTDTLAAAADACSDCWARLVQDRKKV